MQACILRLVIIDSFEIHRGIVVNIFMCGKRGDEFEFYESGKSRLLRYRRWCKEAFEACVSSSLRSKVESHKSWLSSRSHDDGMMNTKIMNSIACWTRR